MSCAGTQYVVVGSPPLCTSCSTRNPVLSVTARRVNLEVDFLRAVHVPPQLTERANPMPSRKIQQPLSTRLKRCSKCDRLQPLERFYAHSRMRDGRWNECKKCHSERRERNRKLKALNGPLAFNSYKRVHGLLISAMELGIRSPKTLPKALKLLERLFTYAERERFDKAGRRTLWDELRNMLLEVPYTERLRILKLLATTLPPKLRPKFKDCDSPPASEDSPSSSVSA